MGSTASPDKDSRVSNLISPGVYYTVNPWLQIWTGFNNRYTRNAHEADQLEIRPFVGFKAFLPNEWDLHLYNFTRYEFRAIDDLETHDWQYIHRIRSRFGVEFPLASHEKAWQRNSWYGLASVEPFFRFDHRRVDPLQASVGLGYILNDNVRLEFYYYANFTHPSDDSLDYTGNIFRLNIKINLNRKAEPRQPAPSL